MRTVSAPQTRSNSSISNTRLRRDSISSSTTGTSGASTLPSRPETPDHEEQSIMLVDRPISNTNAHVGGIDWELAGAGIKLWLTARAQVQLAAGDPLTQRAMHIDAMRYMSMALPNDLSATEIETIRSSLHPRFRQKDERQHMMVVPAKPNALRQGVAQAVCWLIALIFVLIPLIVTAANKAIIYEREHKILERVLKGSAQVTKSMGERGLDLGDHFVRFKDTLLGQTFLSAVAWVIEGFAGGVNDGLVQSTNGHLVLQDWKRQ